MTRGLSPRESLGIGTGKFSKELKLLMDRRSIASSTRGMMMIKSISFEKRDYSDFKKKLNVPSIKLKYYGACGIVSDLGWPQELADIIRPEVVSLENYDGYIIHYHPVDPKYFDVLKKINLK